MPGVIIFDPNDNDAGFSVGDDQANALYLDRETGDLYFADLDTIFKWEGDEPNKMSITWRSGLIRMPRPINMGAVSLEAESYTGTVFKLFAEIDDALQFITSFTVLNGQPIRLPGGYLSNLFQIEITGSDRVTRVAVGENIANLKDD